MIFFAPRPKLSWNARIIRAVAFLTATGISVFFLGLHMFVIADSYAGPNSLPRVAMYLLWLIIWQLVALLPCWRAWMLRRWACFLLFFILPALPYGCMLMVRSDWLTAGALIFTLFSVIAIAADWDHLKSGF
jgi:hypothetical protein